MGKETARHATDRKWNALNRKLTAIIKGSRGVLDKITVPTHDWFYSSTMNELYHYDRGVFEAYPSFDATTFSTHHTIKVLPEDADVVSVTKLPPHDRWHITYSHVEFYTA